MKLDDLVNEHWDELNENDLFCWEIISHNRKECAHMSIEELGRRCSVSRTTILRFAKKIGLSGYSELKFYLRSEADLETVRDEYIDVDIFHHNYEQLLDEMQSKNFRPIVSMIAAANRVFIYGSGHLQRLVAREMCRMFGTIQKYLIHIEGVSEYRDMLSGIQPDDLVIIISCSGESETALNLARQLQVKTVPFISFTELSNNTLSHLASERMYISPKSIQFWKNHKYHSTAMFYVMAEYMFVSYVNWISAGHDAEDSLDKKVSEQLSV